MQSNRLVAVCYQADDEYATMNTEVLGADASLVFVQRLPEISEPPRWPTPRS